MSGAPQAPVSAALAPQRWRWRRWVVLAACLTLTGWFARFAYLRITLRPTPRPEYWAAQLAAIDPPPPGAIPATEAERILESRPWKTDIAIPELAQSADPRLQLPHPMEEPTGQWDQSRPEVAALDGFFLGDPFNRARDALRRAVEAGWQPELRLLPYWQPRGDRSDHGRFWTNWLLTHARWATQYPGARAVAIEDWLIALKLARQLRRSPPVATRLWEWTVLDATVEEMIRSGKAVAGEIDSLTLARQVEEILGPVLSPRELLAGERMIYRNVLERVYVTRGGDWLSVRDVACLKMSMGGVGGVSPSSFWNLASPLFHDLPTAQANVDEYFASFDRCTNIVSSYEVIKGQPGVPMVPEPGVLDGIPPLKQMGYLDSRVTIGRALFAHYALHGSIEGAVTMIAVERYHHKNGTYPQALQELVPRYLPRLPIDYADRQPLRYRRTQDGYILYSIGTNGIDDGGVSGGHPLLFFVFYDKNPDVVFNDVGRPEKAP